MNLDKIGFLLLSVIPVNAEPIAERIDAAEVNHYYDEEGRKVFCQVIYWRWRPAHEDYVVQAWRIVDDPSRIPSRDWQRGGYTATWRDGEIYRRVNVASLRESWTQYDPELVARETLPKERRLELFSRPHQRPQ